MFQELQNAIAAYIGVIPVLAPIAPNIIKRQESNVDALTSEAITSGLGLSVIVLYPFPVKTARNLAGLAASEIMVTLRICEDVQSNNSGLTALQTAEYLHRALQLWVPGTDGLGTCPLTALENNPWRDPATVEGRNEIDINFTIAGEVGPINLLAPADPANGNYRFQNTSVFELFDEASTNYCVVWAATVDGAVTPILADNDDAAPYSGTTFAPIAGANLRTRNGILQLYNPTTNAWHNLAVVTVDGTRSLVLDQTQDTTPVANSGQLLLAGQNYQILSGNTLEILADDGLFYALFVGVVNGVKSILLADTGSESAY